MTSKKYDLKEMSSEKLKLDEAHKILTEDFDFNFPTYTKTLINRANEMSQACRKQHVGQMSEIALEHKDKTFKEWEEWYFETYPDAIDKATDKVYNMIQKYKKALEDIDKELIRMWIYDLVIIKSRKGLYYQELILKHLAEKNNTNYRLATSEEVSKSIDGYIGNKPLQIKPKSYINQQHLHETIDCDIIFYNITDKYLTIYYE